MSTAARDFLAAFDALPVDAKQEVAAEILRRAAAAGELSDPALDELAAEVFRGYDAEEAGRADA